MSFGFFEVHLGGLCGWGRASLGNSRVPVYQEERDEEHQVCSVGIGLGVARNQEFGLENILFETLVRYSGI